MSTFSRWVLRLDGAFLVFAGGVAMSAEIAGHFFGVGPMAALVGSSHTIGGFEAHGLAVLIGVLVFRGEASIDRGLWHTVGLITHVFLGSANILFWPSFAANGIVIVGVVSTILHVIFIFAQTFCLILGRRKNSQR